MKSGSMVEIATVGDEGVLGINSLHGDFHLGGETMMQVPDTDAEVLPIAIFKRELDWRGPLHECVQRYSQGLLMLMMQSTACMALHPVQQPCCRWLLMTHDRVRRDDFQLSHDLLHDARIIAADGDVGSEDAQKAGLIKYVHGRITILECAELEVSSCECYRTIKDHFDRLRF
jgi:hypothetical protein